MQHASLWLVREDAPAASLALAESGAFNPESSEGLRLELPEVPEQHFRETYLAARSRLDKILEHCGCRFEPQVPDHAEPISLMELETLNTRLAEIWNLCFEAQERLRRTEEERQRVQQLLQTLDTFSALDMDLGALLSEHRFLDVRLGTAPAQNAPRLREALALAGFVLEAFAAAENLEHCIVVGPAGRAAEITALLATAGWHSVEVPPELHTHPETARSRLLIRLAELEQETQRGRAELESTRSALQAELQQAENALALAAPYASLVEKSLRGQRGLTLISGWVPTREVARLKRLLQSRLGHPFLLKVRNPEPGERPQVPSVVRQPALLRSFTRLVHTYGVPRYGEIDPTVLFAISFVLMFGMMFGDLGQGAVIAGVGLLLRGRLAAARVLMVSAGCASMVFGVLYGSVFGSEHLIPPVWISPMQDPLRILTLAVYWGIGFILVVSLIKSYNLYVQHGVKAALLDPGGGAGIVFYLGAVAGLIGWVRDGEFGTLPALTATAGAMAMLAYGWHEQKGPASERALVALIETLETVISYFANTLSFMRVGAFSLNHVALALAVFTIAEMLGGDSQAGALRGTPQGDFLRGTGYWIALAIGNVFIMGLEGAIVAIQALRLEYYEGFSRFFSGDGREFRPLMLKGHNSG